MSIDICKELSQNFIDFAYEANSQRAFPDARDGLKPGQRACLWEMYNKGYTSNKPHVKSAKISGGTIASWWPHGDVAVYDTFTRMSQNWINNIPEVDWHGSNGNVVIGPEAASNRYTEARLSKASEDGLLIGLKKNIVPMIPNFSEDEYWPEVLPAIFPRLAINGSQGIGVTIAQVWLPNNLNEIAQAIKTYAETGEIDYSKLAPDFPSGGIIINKDELSSIYTTGKGRVIVRAKTEINKNSILITELPYQVYVESLIEDIKTLIEKEEISGIEDVLNKSDKKRLLIEIECSASPQVILNKLFSATDLQKSYSANQFALVGKTPKLLTFKEYVDIYLAHNVECYKKEVIFDLVKAQARQEIVEGLVKALEDIDNIIAVIKASTNSTDAKTNLIKKYNFTENQAKAIVDMRLGKLAHLEYVELENERKELIASIDNYKNILSNKDLQTKEVLNRLDNFTKKYGFERRTELTQINLKLTKEEKEIAAIPPEKCVVVLTEAGNIKRIATTAFRAQKRAGKGVKTQDDITSMVLRTNTIDSLMIFTNQGNMYRLIVDDIPEGTNTSKGMPVKALVSMEPNEKPVVIYSIYRDTDAKYVVFATKQGYIKRTALEEYIGVKKKNGIKALNLHEQDEIVAVFLANEEQILILSKDGYAIRCKGTEFPASGRVSMGYKGINLKPGDEVIIALPIRNETDDIAIFSNSGTGRRVPLKNFISQARNGRGTIYAKDTDVAAACLVTDGDLVLVCGDKTSLCIKADEMAKTESKTSQGTIVIKGNTKITGVSKV